MGPCEAWCQLNVLAWEREQRQPLGAEGSKEAVGFLHVSRLCWVPYEAWGSPQRQPGLQGPCRSAERINGFPQPSTITKSLWRHQQPPPAPTLPTQSGDSVLATGAQGS